MDAVVASYYGGTSVTQLTTVVSRSRVGLGAVLSARPLLFPNSTAESPETRETLRERGRFGAQVLMIWESSRGSRRVGEWVS